MMIGPDIRVNLYRRAMQQGNGRHDHDYRQALILLFCILKPAGGTLITRPGWPCPRVRPRGHCDPAAGTVTVAVTRTRGEIH